MSYTPGGLVHAVLPMHSTFDVMSSAYYPVVPVASAWPSADRALFVPYAVAAPTWVRRMWAISGNATGNVDLGIYTAAGSRIVSTGSTAQGTANTVNFYDVTDTLLAPGEYLLAAAYASTSATPFRVSASGYAVMYGVMQMASALPLPATATLAVAAAEYLPFFGFSTLAADL